MYISSSVIRHKWQQHPSLFFPVVSGTLPGCTAWFFMLLQAFTSTAAVAASVTAATRPPLPAWSADILSRPAEVHTLAVGESPALLAERLGLTLSQLKTYNQFRTFSKPFERLTVGDELDIPSAVLRAASQSRHTPEDGSQDTTARLASGATMLGGMVDSGDAAEAAAGMARTALTAAANGTVGKWLGQYGAAQVQLNLDDDWKFSDSSIDWLVPLYENPDNLLLSQLGWRKNDDRTTVNLGLGMRWFTADAMYGVNGFYDNDITGENRRLGLGLEYWRDYITLSANGYYRLTDWHQSLDNADWDERPANGWDIRLNGWLPSYPQLGGKLVYEKYYGEKVGLFGHEEDQLQKTPYAVTAGIS